MKGLKEKEGKLRQVHMSVILTYKNKYGYIDSVQYIVYGELKWEKPKKRMGDRVS